MANSSMTASMMSSGVSRMVQVSGSAAMSAVQPMTARDSLLPRLSEHLAERKVWGMREEIQELLRLGQLPSGDDLGEEEASQFADAIDGLPSSLTAAEAVALTSILPADDSTSFGLAWSVLHAIEAASGWPIWSALDDRNWWVTLLRKRGERGGLRSAHRTDRVTHSHPAIRSVVPMSGRSEAAGAGLNRMQRNG
jgi:hypothetical protein